MKSREPPTSDSKLVKSSLTRITENYGQPASYTGDRGFDSPESRAHLDELELINGICPRSVPALKEKLEDEGFRLLQKRRGSTEGLVGLFKNAYLGTPLRSKGYANRKTRIEWPIRVGHKEGIFYGSQMSCLTSQCGVLGRSPRVYTHASIRFF